jgi:hypothetical protein
VGSGSAGDVCKSSTRSGKQKSVVQKFGKSPKKKEGKEEIIWLKKYPNNRNNTSKLFIGIHHTKHF